MVAKTTLYFNRDLYQEIKKTALEERISVTEFIQETLATRLRTPRKDSRKRIKSKLPPGLPLGASYGKYRTFSREEIYDFI